MAHPGTINRKTLLDAAGVLLHKQGAPSLSFGAIAAESGQSKADGQSAFGTRERILGALLGRWMGKSRKDSTPVGYQINDTLWAEILMT